MSSKEGTSEESLEPSFISMVDLCSVKYANEILNVTTRSHCNIN